MSELTSDNGRNRAICDYTLFTMLSKQQYDKILTKKTFFKLSHHYPPGLSNRYYTHMGVISQLLLYQEKKAAVALFAIFISQISVWLYLPHAYLENALFAAQWR